MKFDTLKFISDLVEFPSVSADSNHAEDVRKCAMFLKDKFEGFGFSVDFHETGLYPILFARRDFKGGKPKVRILCYGHYDVQPADPFEKWNTPPFKAEIKNGKIWGRGTADNKGPFSCIIAGMMNFLFQNPDAPIDIAFMLEGEEEIGSPSMSKFIEDNAKLLSSYDFMMLSDTSSASLSQIVVTIGLRGTGSLDARFKGANTDVHSGMYGGMIYNPLQAMAEVCATLHDRDGFVNIPHFYDGVETLGDWERGEIAKSPFDEEAVKKLLGVEHLYVQKGYTPAEASRVLPTLEFTGMGGGYQGEGSKSVIPSECFCKISCRTASGQKTDAILELVKKAVKERTPDAIKVEFTDYDASGDAYFVNPKDNGNAVVKNAFAAMEECVEKEFGSKPIYLREGASIPLISKIKNATGLDCMMVGLFTPEDNLHAPNEGFYLEMVDKASAYYERFFNRILEKC